MTSPRRIERRPYLLADARGLAAGGGGTPGESPREISDDDLAAVAELMSAAFRGTVDDEGETVDELTGQLHDAARGEWGAPLRSGWLALVDGDDRLLSAVITTRWWDTPFIAMVATAPAARGRGLATFLIRTVAGQAVASGQSRIGLIVTRDNPAIGFYDRLGFVEHDRPSDAT